MTCKLAKIIRGVLLRDMRHSDKSRTTSGWSLRTKGPCSLIVLKRVDGLHCSSEVSEGSRQPFHHDRNRSVDEVRCASTEFQH